MSMICSQLSTGKEIFRKKGQDISKVNCGVFNFSKNEPKNKSTSLGTIHLVRQHRTGWGVGFNKRQLYADVHYCIYADFTPLVGESEKVQKCADVIHIWILIRGYLTLPGPAFFLGQSWTGGRAIRPRPALVSQPWGIWGISAKHNFCDHFSEDYFEVYKISLAQNLTILETIMRFCWKIQKIRTIF